MSEEDRSSAEFEIPVVETDLVVGSVGGAELRKGAFRVSNADEDAAADDDEEESDHLVRRVREAEAAVRTDATRLVRHAVFDVLFWAAARFSRLSDAAKTALIDATCTSVSSVARAIQAHPALAQQHSSQQSSSQQALLTAAEATTFRNSLKMSVFLLAWVVKLAERDAIDHPPTAPSSSSSSSAAALPPKTPSRAKRGRVKDDITGGGGGGGPQQHGWTDETRERALSALLEALETEGLALLWRAPRPEEGFVAMFTRTAFLALESPTTARNKTLRRCVALMVGTLVKTHGQGVAVTATAVHMLHSHEHLPAPLAELYATVATEFDGAHAVGSVIREIAKLEPAELSREATLARNVAVFLSELAERMPRVVLPAVSVLLPHLRGGESHVVRSGIVHTLGILALKAFDDSDAAAASEDGSRAGADMATRDSLLGVLEERFLDVSSYTRSKALQTWVPLVKARAVPLSRLRSVTEKTVGRLDDKAAQVRRSAVQLLTVLLQFNPFSPRLVLSSFRQKRQLCDAVFEEIEQNPSGDEGGVADDEGIGGGGRNGDESESLKAVSKQRIAEIFAGTPFEREWKGGSGTTFLRELRRFHTWAKDGAAFAEAMGKTVSRVVELLVSRNTTDTTEAMEFVVAAEQFAVEGATVGVRRMLYLAWAKEAPVRDALVDSFTALVFSRPRARDVAEALIGLARGATPAEAVSMEELVWLATEKGRLDASVATALTDAVQQQTKDSTESETRERRRAAMNVLGMVACADPFLVASKIGTIVTTALGPEWAADATLAMRACEVLQRLRRDDVGQQQQQQPITVKQEGEEKKEKKGRRKKRDSNEGDEGDDEEAAPAPAPDEALSRVKSKNERKPRPAGISRLSNEHELFGRLCAVIEGESIGTSSSELKPGYASWAPVAEQAMNAVALLAENPDHIFEAVIAHLHKAAFTSAGVSSERLARLLFAVGHAAIKMLVHIEIVAKHMESAALQQKHTATKIAQEEGKKGKKGKHKTSTTTTTVGVDEGEGEGAGVVAEATEAEAAQMAAEREIVAPNGLIGSYVPLVRAVCTNTGGTFNNTHLRAASVVALGKLAVAGGADFSAAQISLLVTVLETAPEAELRATVVAALGDLCARFPNVAEPWTPHLYARLRDPDPHVRRNAAAVLAQLVLNDMIKLKGHVAAIALALEDNDDRVRELARLFFTELAKKGNAVYNVLPDAISSLSAACSATSAAAAATTETQQQKDEQKQQRQAAVSWDSFRRIVKFLFGFLQKERQFEALLEKLCARFRTTEDARAIAFCLTQLTLNERCVRKLIELYPAFQDKLHDDEVYDSFNAVVARARKFARPEMKVAVDELECKIASSRSLHSQQGGSQLVTTLDACDTGVHTPTKEEEEEGETAAATAAVATTGKKRRGGGTAAGRTATTGKRKSRTATTAGKGKKGKSKGKGKKRATSDDESSDSSMPSLPSSSGESDATSDQEEKSKPRAKPKKNPTKKKQPVKKKESEDSS